MKKEQVDTKGPRLGRSLARFWWQGEGDLFTPEDEIVGRKKFKEAREGRIQKPSIVIWKVD